MKTKTILFIAILTAVSITSCRKSMFVRGNKNVTTVERQLSEFDKVANDGSFEVTIIEDDEHFVVIEAESNLISHIDTRISNGALIIDTDENLINRRPMKLFVHTDKLRAVELNGSGFIHTETFNSEEFSAVLDGSGDISASIMDCEDTYVRVSGSGNLAIDVDTESMRAEIHGSGDLRISGEGISSNMEIHGSGSIRSYDFNHESSNAVVDGSGSIYLYVTDYLNAKIFGSGSIYYAGNPSDVDKEINGSGNIIKQ